ncbi:MAG: SDR family oxidoreductase [Lewinellaceae bacterium]|nr:SDR family oxidoreductase [Lewinellaceae bacterium]
MYQKQFSGKTALITGSGSGIGKSTALAFCRAGGSVMLNGRNAEKLQKACAELQDMGFSVACCAADVQNYAECSRLVQETLDRFGRLDVVVTNASLSMRAEFAQMEPAIFRQVLDSNILSPAYTAHAALPALMETRGSLVFIGSLSGLIGLPTGSAYSAGKMALTALAQSLRLELLDAGVHVGIAYVGFTQNDPDKRVFDAAGNMVPVAERAGWMQQSQEQVAQSIIRLALRRKKRVILSPLGKFLHALNTLSPSLTEWAVQRSFKRMARMYKGIQEQAS